MITAVDTNVLLDLLLPDEPRGQEAERALANALLVGALIVSEPVYAELAVSFTGQPDLDGFLAATGIRVEPSRRESLHRAGVAWRQYARQRRAAVTCGQCGNEQEVHCARCGAAIRLRQHVLADFLIGAHAAVQADRLLTRDRRTYRTYFPELTLI